MKTVVKCCILLAKLITKGVYYMQKSSSGLQENVASLLCYLFGWLSGLIFYFIEPNNKTVRFHALQSILFCVSMIPIVIVMMILFTIFAMINLAFVSALLWFVFGIGVFIVWILLMVKAYKGNMWKLPIIGNLAAKWSTK